MNISLLSYAFVLVVLIPGIISTVAIVRYGRAVRTRAATRWATVSVVAFALSVSTGLAHTLALNVLRNPERYQKLSVWISDVSGVLSFVVGLTVALTLRAALRDATLHYSKAIECQGTSESER